MPARRIATAAAVAVLAAGASAALAGTAAAPVPRVAEAPAHEESAKRRTVRLVTIFSASGFGRVLATRSGRALYWWTQDGRNRVRCTGACARAWPPLIVPRGATVRRRIPGVRGRFGVVRRPDGRRQVTYQGYPVYAYVNEGPRVVGCDDANGWLVARARGLR